MYFQSPLFGHFFQYRTIFGASNKSFFNRAAQIFTIYGKKLATDFINGHQKIYKCLSVSQETKKNHIKEAISYNF